MRTRKHSTNVNICKPRCSYIQILKFDQTKSNIKDEHLIFHMLVNKILFIVASLASDPFKKILLNLLFLLTLPLALRSAPSPYKNPSPH